MALRVSVSLLRHQGTHLITRFMLTFFLSSMSQFKLKYIGIYFSFELKTIKPHTIRKVLNGETEKTVLTIVCVQDPYL